MLCRTSTKNSYAMHTIKIIPNLLFEYQCTSGKFIRLPNRIETFFCPNWNALPHDHAHPYASCQCRRMKRWRMSYLTQRGVGTVLISLSLVIIQATGSYTNSPWRMAAVTPDLQLPCQQNSHCHCSWSIIVSQRRVEGSVGHTQDSLPTVTHLSTNRKLKSNIPETTVTYLPCRVFGSTLTAVGRFQLLARWPGTHSRILSGIKRAP